MKKRNIYKSYRLILLLFIIFILIGCKKGSQKPDISKKGNIPKLPKVLEELEDETLKIMYDLDSVPGIEKAIEEEKALKAKQTASVKTIAIPIGQWQLGKNIGGKELKIAKGSKSKQTEEKVDMQELITESEIIIPLLKAQEVKGTFAKSKTPPPDIETVWSKISDNAMNVHKKWNVLEAQLPVEKTSQEKINEFEKILDDLTISIIDKKRLGSLTQANELTRVIAGLRNHFDGMGNSNVFEMYYHVRGVILSAAIDDYAGAINHLNETTKIGDSMRQDLVKKGSKNVLKKFELSTEDLGDQLVDENFQLSQIKAPIVIKNIKLIQDAFEMQKQSQ